jgi:uncharacterized membrane protein YgcG
MIRAADRSSFRIHRRKAVFILVVAGGLALAASTLAFERGPYLCTDCAVASPVPDARTLETLKRSRAPIDYVPLFAWATGTTYQICNPTHCTVYHENFEGNWVGEGQTVRQGELPQPIDEGDGGGGGGGGMGDGGGPGVGGGGFGGGECSVHPRTGNACSTVNGISHCQTFDDSFVDCGFG